MCCPTNTCELRHPPSQLKGYDCGGHLLKFQNEVFLFHLRSDFPMCQTGGSFTHYSESCPVPWWEGSYHACIIASAHTHFGFVLLLLKKKSGANSHKMIHLSTDHLSVHKSIHKTPINKKSAIICITMCMCVCMYTYISNSFSTKKTPKRSKEVASIVNSHLQIR